MHAKNYVKTKADFCIMKDLSFSGGLFSTYRTSDSALSGIGGALSFETLESGNLVTEEGLVTDWTQ